MNDSAELNKMSTTELVAYWNILQFNQRCIQIDPQNKNQRHHNIVLQLLQNRNISPTPGKRLIHVAQ